MTFRLPMRPKVKAQESGDPLARREAVVLRDLQDLAVVGFDPELEIRREIDRLLATEQIDVNVVMEFDNIETIKGAVKINAGISLLPQPTVEAEVASGALVAVPVNGLKLDRPLGIIHRRGKQLGKTARRFLQFLQDIAHQRNEPPDKAQAHGPTAAPAASDGDSNKYAAPDGSQSDSKPARLPALAPKA